MKAPEISEKLKFPAFKDGFIQTYRHHSNLSYQKLLVVDLRYFAYTTTRKNQNFGEKFLEQQSKAYHMISKLQ